MQPKPDPARPDQESVWDYPRPPIIEPAARRLEVQLDGLIIASTRRGQRVLETSHPPTYYFPFEDCDAARLRPNPKRSLCEWKGTAHYWDVVTGAQDLVGAAWSYPDPTPSSGLLPGSIAFYAHVLECFVDGERVRPQPGGFYGGWVTSHVAGPFKGVPGSWGW